MGTFPDNLYSHPVLEAWLDAEREVVAMGSWFSLLTPSHVLPVDGLFLISSQDEVFATPAMYYVCHETGYAITRVPGIEDRVISIDRAADLVLDGLYGASLEDE